MKFGGKNVGQFDRAVRILLGLFLCGAMLWGLVYPPISYIVALIALALLVTGILGTCTLYGLLGISTAKPAARKR